MKGGDGMAKGPILNNISKNFTTRDSLGIEGVATSMQAEICPVVNTVTPRAFYWPFMIWIYYDFYKYSGIAEHTVEAFDAYLKRQDYFFVLATLLTKGSDQNNLVGKQQSQIDIDRNTNGLFPYNKAYFKTRYGGMQYYNAGCLSMLFVTDEDPENNRTFQLPKLRPEGERMAKAFEAVIKDTQYYKNYRRNDVAVPKNVLEEYGKVINFGLKGFDECKQILRRYMFEDDRATQFVDRSKRLSDCADLIKLIIKDYKVEQLNGSTCRAILYDHMLPSGKILNIPENCLSVAKKWEIVVGRMYFTSGIEMLWKYMLEQLIEPLTIREWISHSIYQSRFNWNIKNTLSEVIGECNYDFYDREDMIAATARRNTSPYSIENGIRVILSVYNRFQNRNDLEEEKKLLHLGRETQSIALTEMFELVDGFLNKPIFQFAEYIMRHWIIEQHYLTAFDKMIQGRDGFYYEVINDRYIKKHDFDMAFQGIRMVQLAQVMRDLDLL